MNKKPAKMAPTPLPPNQNPATRLQSAAMAGDTMNATPLNPDAVSSVKSKLMQAKRSQPGVGFKAPLSDAAKGVKKAMARKPSSMMGK